MFNKDTFLQQGQAPTANSTFVIQCPAGDQRGVVSKVDAEQFAGTKDPNKLFTKLVLHVDVTDPAVLATCKRDKVTLRHDIFLDLLEDGSGLDMSEGKNIGLGKAREALGLNIPGKPWSFADFIGRPVIVNVEHENVRGEIFARAAKLARMQ